MSGVCLAGPAWATLPPKPSASPTVGFASAIPSHDPSLNGAGPESPSSATCGKSGRQPPAPWISSSGDSPARTSAAPEPGPASPGPGPACGRSTRESFASYDHGTRSWRTSRPCLVAAWTGSWEIWPRSGMMRNGTCFRRRPLAPPTCASGLSLLPTPAAIEGEPVKQYLRREESWTSTGNLTARLIGMVYGLKDREPRPPLRLIASPWFVEWMMGVPTGWTDSAVSATASRLLSCNGSWGG